LALWKGVMQATSGGVKTGVGNIKIRGKRKMTCCRLPGIALHAQRTITMALARHSLSVECDLLIWRRRLHSVAPEILVRISIVD
jgi:hypothetical protein